MLLLTQSTSSESLWKRLDTELGPDEEDSDEEEDGDYEGGKSDDEDDDGSGSESEGDEDEGEARKKVKKVPPPPAPSADKVREGELWAVEPSCPILHTCVCMCTRLRC